MTEVTVSVAGPDLSAAHSKSVVRSLFNVFRIHGPGETRPATVTVKFVEGREKRLAGNDVHVEAGGIMIPIGILKGTLSGALLGDAKLLAGETRDSVRIFCVFGNATPSLIRSSI